MDGRAPLSLKELGKGEPWFACGALYSATEEMGKAAQAHVASVLAGKGYASEFTDFTDRLEEAARTPFLGAPTEENLRSVYWRKRHEKSPGTVDPDRDRCGIVWMCPEAPFDGSGAVEAIRLAEEALPRHGFEPHIGLMIRSPRSLKMFVAIVYDRDEEGDDARALACHDELLSSFVGLGFIPYRLGLQSMDLLPPADVYDSVIDGRKALLDPGNILAPGRYDFRASGQQRGR